MSPKKHLSTTHRPFSSHFHQQHPNSCTLTTLIKSISTLHNSFHTPHHFPKFLVGFMSVSAIAGYWCMDWWYETSVRERTEIYSNAYHHHDGEKVRSGTRDEHYKGRKALFENKVRRTKYQEALYKQQGVGQEDEGRLATLAKRLTTTLDANHQGVGLQRQVTRFW